VGVVETEMSNTTFSSIQEKTSLTEVESYSAFLGIGVSSVALLSVIVIYYKMKGKRQQTIFLSAPQNDQSSEVDMVCC
jgi:hypothetical protein